MSEPAQQNLPRHVAIIMDGNGRWAKQRMMPRIMGHRQGATRVQEIVQASAEQGIEVLTLFAFSTENWRRPEEEVSGLMRLFLESLKKERDALHQNNIRLRIIGDRSRFVPEIQAAIEAAEKLTADNNGMVLNVAANYGGRWDIVQAVKSYCQTQKGDVSGLTPERLAEHLSTAGLPEPDLLIRTGGEHRISNFMIWQLAYTEFYFTDLFWPDFDHKAYQAALADYAARQRRFGCVES